MQSEVGNHFVGESQFTMTPEPADIGILPYPFFFFLWRKKFRTTISNFGGKNSEGNNIGVIYFGQNILWPVIQKRCFLELSSLINQKTRRKSYSGKSSALKWSISADGLQFVWNFWLILILHHFNFICNKEVSAGNGDTSSPFVKIKMMHDDSGGDQPFRCVYNNGVLSKNWYENLGLAILSCA